MINSISGVSFGNNMGVLDKVSQEQLSNPGMYSQPIILQVPPQQPKRQGGFLSFIGRTIKNIIIIGGLAIAGRKVLMRNYKVLDKMPEGSKFGAKCKNNFAKYTDILYDNTVVRLKKLYQNKKKARVDGKGGGDQKAETTNAK